MNTVNLFAISYNYRKYGVKYIYRFLLSYTICVNYNYQKGYSNANLEILDIQFQNYKKGQLPGNIILLQKISSSVVTNRYGNSEIVREFIEKLSAQNLIID